MKHKNQIDYLIQFLTHKLFKVKAEKKKIIDVVQNSIQSLLKNKIVDFSLNVSQFYLK